MAARLELWEPCFGCNHRELTECHTSKPCEYFEGYTEDYYETCRHFAICKLIDGLEPITFDSTRGDA